jgi:anti-anti-sigma factor
MVETLLVVIAETALATYVATRAWDYRPARLFVVLITVLLIQNVTSFLRAQAPDVASAYPLRVISSLGLAGIDLALLLLFSSLFVPQWWERRRPIVWISLPYIVLSVALAIDLIGRLGIFVSGIRFEAGDYSFNLARPAGPILLTLFTVSWLVHLSILLVAFVRVRRARPALAVLTGALIFGAVIGQMQLLVAEFAGFAGLLQIVPLLAALAYLVLRTQLVIPIRAALDKALRAMSEAVAVLTLEGQVVYANPPARALGLSPDESRAPTDGQQDDAHDRLAHYIAQHSGLEAPRTETLEFAQRQIEVTIAPFTDADGRTRGMLLLGRDVTELARRTALLEEERTQLAETVRQLEEEQQRRTQLTETVRALSLPLIPVMDGVLVLPLVGSFDQERADEFMRVLLHGIEREQARLVLLDVTGIPLLDTTGARRLMQGVQAAALLGARCVLVGVRPEIAQSLVVLGVSLDELGVAATLQQAVQDELRPQMLEHVSNRSRHN